MFKRSVNRRLFGLLAAGVILVIANELGWLSPVSSALGTLSKPVLGLFGGLGSGVSGWFQVVGSATQLGNENQRLRAEVASLRQQLSQDTELRAQNDTLRKQLGVGSIRADRLIAAEVIGYQPDNFRQFITIGRGSRDGIRTGMAVVEQGTLIGTVDEVNATSAKVFLVIDPNFRVAALDQDAPNRPTGIIHGQIGNGLILDKVAQTENLKPGDTIVTSGLANDIEKGLIIGRVQTVDKKDNGVFQTAQVTSDIQFSRLEVVYVVARSL